MKLCRCPICHSDLTLEALVEDDAGRELLKTITEMTAGCGRPAVAYLGLFKPAKSSLSNGRALRILQGLLELYPCSNVLAKALADTVEQVRRNRRENGKFEPLNSHNYLKKVYESVKPQFAVVRTEENNQVLSSEEAQERAKSDNRTANIQYIDRLVRLRGEDECVNLHGFADWKQWQQEKENVRTNS
ncbi:hypothetical protein [Glaesserella parasuis]|uniref:hypothetical protein n=1 Tax=Glaesserella parasuis TaxID=738 RepID=UPI0008FC3705|nr:hypothetical protein [Glaesserella parasuis]OIT23279.1 hypothetical protein BLL93_11975 [Glaesserella parasuis]